MESASGRTLSIAEESGILAERYKSKHVLVTGAFRFLGGALIKRLLLLGARVTALDIDTSESRPSSLNMGPDRPRDHVSVITGDVADADVMRAAIRNEPFDVIFHLAAFAVIEKAAAYPLDAIRADTMSVVCLLEAVRALEQRVHPSAIVFASTDKVYGEMECDQYDEQTPLRGIGIYDAAKLSGDVFARSYFEVFGLPSVVIRLCNVFGPGDFNTDYRLIPKALKSIYEEERPRPPALFFDSIEHWRDYLYVDDATRALLLLGCQPRCRGEVFNAVATKHACTPEMLRTVVEHAAKYEREYDPAKADVILQNGIRAHCPLAARRRPDHQTPTSQRDQDTRGPRLRASGRTERRAHENRRVLSPVLHATPPRVNINVSIRLEEFPMRKLASTRANGFAYPRGWFVVCFSDEIAVGTVRRLQYFGRELVAFRGEGGAIHVLDGYCPHLGALLAAGGIVVGDSIQCPFHKWRYAGNGECVEQPGSTKIPPTCRTGAWPVTEKNDLVFVYHDPTGAPPRYSISQIPEYGESDWLPWQGRATKRIRAYSGDIVENMADIAHFAPVHYTPLDLEGTTLSLTSHKCSASNARGGAPAIIARRLRFRMFQLTQVLDTKLRSTTEHRGLSFW